MLFFIAVALFAVVKVIRWEAAEFGSILIYSLVIGNVAWLPMDVLSPYANRVRSPFNWMAYFFLLFVVALASSGAALFATMTVYRVPLGAFHVHDVVLTAFAEQGAVGVVVLGWLWWSFGRALRAALREAPPAQRRFALALAAGLVATWVQGAFDFVSIVVMGCWLPFLSLALAAARYGLPR